MIEPGYRLVLAATAERSLVRLTASAATAIVEFMLGPLVEAPHRLGHRLRGDLAGLWSARCGPYRVVYEIDDDEHVVAVIRVDHRADVYRPR